MATPGSVHLRQQKIVTGFAAFLTAKCLSCSADFLKKKRKKKVTLALSPLVELPYFFS